MKPAAFDYLAVHTPQEAVSALAENPEETRILAGGQSLVLDMNYRRERPARLVDINGVAELDRLEVSDKTLRVGALVRHRSFEEPVVTGPLGRLLSRVSHYVAHPPIRTRGTMIGSLAYAHPAAEWPTGPGRPPRARRPPPAGQARGAPHGGGLQRPRPAPAPDPRR